MAMNHVLIVAQDTAKYRMGPLQFIDAEAHEKWMGTGREREIQSTTVRRRDTKSSHIRLGRVITVTIYIYSANIGQCNCCLDGILMSPPSSAAEKPLRLSSVRFLKKTSTPMTFTHHAFSAHGSSE